MPWMLPAAIGGAGVLGLGGALGAAGEQASGQKAAAQTELAMFNALYGMQQPFVQGGYKALNSLLYGLGTGGTATPGMTPGQFTQQFTPADLTASLSPGYEFQLQTGAQSLQNAAAPTTGALSGPALKSLMSYNQGQANTAYQQAFSNWQQQQSNIFGRLSQIAGLGQSGASMTGNVGTTLGTGMAQAGAAAAGSQAGGIVGATNAATSGMIPLAYLMSGQNAGLPSGGMLPWQTAAVNAAAPYQTYGGQD